MSDPASVHIPVPYSVLLYTLSAMLASDLLLGFCPKQSQCVTEDVKTTQNLPDLGHQDFLSASILPCLQLSTSVQITVPYAVLMSTAVEKLEKRRHCVGDRGRGLQLRPWGWGTSGTHPAGALVGSLGKACRGTDGNALHTVLWTHQGRKLQHSQN